MSTLIRRISLTVLLWLVVGCSSQPQPSLTPQVSVPQVPAPQVSPLTDALNSPIPSTPLPMVIPTPSAGKGAIVGTFLVQGQGLPMAGVDVFLGQLLGSTEDSKAPVFGMDLKTAPHEVTDQWGRFAFSDVTPGTYNVILWNPMTSVMAQSADGQALKVTVEPQKAVDLGVLTEPIPGR